MTPDEAIAFAREWQKGLTMYEGAQGWRVVCMVLADEVERLRIACEADASANGMLIDQLIVQSRERDELRRRVDELESGFQKVRSDAVLDARDCSVLAHEHGNNHDYSKGFDDAIAQYDEHMERFAAYIEANQIEGGE